MKILILSHKPPYPPKDGGSIAIFNLAKGLAINDNDIDLLAMNTLKHHVSANKINCNIPSLNIEYVEVNTNINALSLLLNFLFSKLPYTATRFFSESFKNKVIDYIQNNSYDIVQLEGPYLGYLITIIRKYSKSKIVIRAHNIEHEIWKRIARNEKNLFKKYYYFNLSKRIIKYEKKIIQHSDAVLPITERDKEAYIQFGITLPMQVAPVGIELKIEEIKITRQRAIMFLGALDWAPNQEGLLWFTENVWPLVLKKNHYIIFHIAGRNAPYWLQRKLSLVRNILFYGEVDKSADFLSIADIMVVPILSGSGMRVKIIEAMSMGKLVITTSIGAEGIPAINNEHLIITDSPEEYADKIISLLKNEKEIEKIAVNAFNFVNTNFNNKSIAKEVSDFYHSLV